MLLVASKPHLIPGLRSLSLVTILTELTRLVFVSYVLPVSCPFHLKCVSPVL